MVTTETRIEAMGILMKAMEDKLTIAETVDLLNEHGLLSEDTGPGRTLRTDEEWGLMYCANYPADAEVEEFLTRMGAEDERDDIRRMISEGKYSASDYEPMKIVRRLVPIRPKPPWETVDDA